MLLSVGLGLSLWYGQQWMSLPRYSEADIDGSVELNLQLDLQRRNESTQPDAGQLAHLRQMVRAEVLDGIRDERAPVETGLGIGLMALVAGAAQLGVSLWVRRRGAAE